MSGFELDLDRVKAVLSAATADQRVMSQRRLSRLVAGERGRDTVGDIIHGRNKNPTATLLARIAEQLGGDLSMFGLPIGIDEDEDLVPDLRALLKVLPSAAELETILAEIRERMPGSLPSDEWPRAVAEGLRLRLEMLLRDRSNADKPRRRAGAGRVKAAPVPAPTSGAEPA